MTSITGTTSDDHTVAQFQASVKEWLDTAGGPAFFTDQEPPPLSHINVRGDVGSLLSNLRLVNDQNRMYEQSLHCRDAVYGIGSDILFRHLCLHHNMKRDEPTHVPPRTLANPESRMNFCSEAPAKPQKN